MLYNLQYIAGVSFPVGWIVALIPPTSSVWYPTVGLAIQGALLALNCYFWGFCFSRILDAFT